MSDDSFELEDTLSDAERLYWLERDLLFDTREPEFCVASYYAQWGEVKEILQKNPDLRTTLVIPDREMLAFDKEMKLVACEVGNMIKAATLAVEKHRHYDTLHSFLDLYIWDSDVRWETNNPLYVTMRSHGISEKRIIMHLNEHQDVIVNAIGDLFELSLGVCNYKAVLSVLHNIDYEGYSVLEEDFRKHSSKFAAMLGESVEGVDVELDGEEEVMEEEEEEEQEEEEEEEEEEEMEEFERRDLGDLGDCQELMVEIVQVQQERVARRLKIWRRMLRMFNITNFWWKVAGEGQHCTHGRGRIRARNEFEAANFFIF